MVERRCRYLGVGTDKKKKKFKIFFFFTLAPLPSLHHLHSSTYAYAPLPTFFSCIVFIYTTHEKLERRRRYSSVGGGAKA